MTKHTTPNHLQQKITEDIKLAQQALRDAEKLVESHYDAKGDPPSIYIVSPSEAAVHWANQAIYRLISIVEGQQELIDQLIAARDKTEEKPVTWGDITEGKSK